MIQDLLLIFIAAALVNNVVLLKFWGICPFLGVSRRVSTALGMSFAVLFVMTMSSIVTWFIYELALKPFKLEYLQTIAFILIIASLVQLVELALQKLSPPLYKALGIFLPLITTNCAVMGVALYNIQEGHDLLHTTIYSLGAATGFGIAILLFAGLRERLELANPPKALRGTALALVTAGMLALAFMGFSGLVKL